MTKTIFNVLIVLNLSTCLSITSFKIFFAIWFNSLLIYQPYKDDPHFILINFCFKKKIIDMSVLLWFLSDKVKAKLKFVGAFGANL